jgi:hypothetical protein
MILTSRRIRLHRRGVRQGIGASGYNGAKKTDFIPLARKQVDYTRFDLLLDFFAQRNRSSSSTPPATPASRTWTRANSTRPARWPATRCCRRPSRTPARRRAFRGGTFRAAAFSGRENFRERKNARRKGHDQAGAARARGKKIAAAIHGFTETDTPNFSFRDQPCSFYSGTKALGEEAMAGIGQSYIWRLRIPFDEFDNRGII